MDTHTLLMAKVHLVKTMFFPVVVYGCENKEGWAPKNWCFWTVILEKTPKSPLDSKEIKPVHPKGNQSWIFTARTNVEAEIPILWPPDAKSWLIWKDCDDVKDWRRKKKGRQRMRWYHWLNGHEFEQAPGDSERQGSLACCNPCGHKESDTTQSKQQPPKICP